MATGTISAGLTGAIQNAINQKVEFYVVTQDNVDSSPSGLRIGMGILNNYGYVAFDIQWTKVEFRCYSGYLYHRFKYGNNPWTEWKAF